MPPADAPPGLAPDLPPSPAALTDLLARLFSGTAGHGSTPTVARALAAIASPAWPPSWVGAFQAALVEQWRRWLQAVQRHSEELRAGADCVTPAGPPWPSPAAVSAAVAALTTATRQLSGHLSWLHGVPAGAAVMPALLQPVLATVADLLHATCHASHAVQPVALCELRCLALRALLDALRLAPPAIRLLSGPDPEATASPPSPPPGGDPQPSDSLTETVLQALLRVGRGANTEKAALLALMALLQVSAVSQFHASLSAEESADSAAATDAGRDGDDYDDNDERRRRPGPWPATLPSAGPHGLHAVADFLSVALFEGTCSPAHTSLAGSPDGVDARVATISKAPVAMGQSLMAGLPPLQQVRLQVLLYAAAASVVDPGALAQRWRQPPTARPADTRHGCLCARCCLARHRGQVVAPQGQALPRPLTLLEAMLGHCAEVLSAVAAGEFLLDAADPLGPRQLLGAAYVALGHLLRTAPVTAAVRAAAARAWPAVLRGFDLARGEPWGLEGLLAGCAALLRDQAEAPAVDFPALPPRAALAVVAVIPPKAIQPGFVWRVLRPAMAADEMAVAAQALVPVFQHVSYQDRQLLLAELATYLVQRAALEGEDETAPGKDAAPACGFWHHAHVLSSHLLRPLIRADDGVPRELLQASLATAPPTSQPASPLPFPCLALAVLLLHAGKPVTAAALAAPLCVAAPAPPTAAALAAAAAHRHWRLRLLAWEVLTAAVPLGRQRKKDVVAPEGTAAPTLLPFACDAVLRSLRLDTGLALNVPAFRSRLTTLFGKWVDRLQAKLRADPAAAAVVGPHLTAVRATLGAALHASGHLRQRHLLTLLLLRAAEPPASNPGSVTDGDPTGLGCAGLELAPTLLDRLAAGLDDNPLATHQLLHGRGVVGGLPSTRCQDLGQQALEALRSRRPETYECACVLLLLLMDEAQLAIDVDPSPPVLRPAPSPLARLVAAMRAALWLIRRQTTPDPTASGVADEPPAEDEEEGEDGDDEAEESLVDLDPRDRRGLVGPLHLLRLCLERWAAAGTLPPDGDPSEAAQFTAVVRDTLRTVGLLLLGALCPVRVAGWGGGQSTAGAQASHGGGAPVVADWRALKAAAALLGALVATGAAAAADAGCAADATAATPACRSLGPHRYTAAAAEWAFGLLLASTHSALVRGAYRSLQAVAGALLRSPCPALAALPAHWMECLLALCAGDDPPESPFDHHPSITDTDPGEPPLPDLRLVPRRHSALRRSTGLPYAVQALLAAEQRAGAALGLARRCLPRLLAPLQPAAGVADVPAHQLHVLQRLVTDSVAWALLEPHGPLLVRAALRTFASGYGQRAAAAQLLASTLGRMLAIDVRAGSATATRTHPSPGPDIMHVAVMYPTLVTDLRDLFAAAEGGELTAVHFASLALLARLSYGAVLNFGGVAGNCRVDPPCQLSDTVAALCRSLLHPWRPRSLLGRKALAAVRDRLPEPDRARVARLAAAVARPADENARHLALLELLLCLQRTAAEAMAGPAGDTPPAHFVTAFGPEADPFCCLPASLPALPQLEPTLQSYATDLVAAGLWAMPRSPITAAVAAQAGAQLLALWLAAAAAAGRDSAVMTALLAVAEEGLHFGEALLQGSCAQGAPLLARDAVLGHAAALCVVAESAVAWAAGPSASARQAFCRAAHQRAAQLLTLPHDAVRRCALRWMAAASVPYDAALHLPVLQLTASLLVSPRPTVPDRERMALALSTLTAVAGCPDEAPHVPPPGAVFDALAATLHNGCGAVAMESLLWTLHYHLQWDCPPLTTQLLGVGARLAEAATRRLPALVELPLPAGCPAEDPVGGAAPICAHVDLLLGLPELPGWDDDAVRLCAVEGLLATGLLQSAAAICFVPDVVCRAWGWLADRLGDFDPAVRRCAAEFIAHELGGDRGGHPVELLPAVYAHVARLAVPVAAPSRRPSAALLAALRVLCAPSWEGLLERQAVAAAKAAALARLLEGVWSGTDTNLSTLSSNVLHSVLDRPIEGVHDVAVVSAASRAALGCAAAQSPHAALLQTLRLRVEGPPSQ